VVWVTSAANSISLRIVAGIVVTIVVATSAAR
jgi:hypothetical protein